jgi:DNA transposition AAA+ family ATPase
MNETLEKTPHEASEVRQLRAYIDDLLTAGIRPSRIAVESGVSLQRLNAWINGSGGENIIPSLLSWKTEVENSATALARGFVMTPTAQRIINAFDRARLSQGKVAHADRDSTDERGIALIYGASGVGKTEAAEWYKTQHQATREIGTWPVVVVRCTGRERDAESTNAAILDSIGNSAYYNLPHKKKIDTILSRVPEGGIIIFDEAQLLKPRRLDELRYFPDKCGIAIALMGNLTGYKELFEAKIAQIMSRVGGARVVVDLPTEGDVDALLEALEIRGRKVREVALMIGIQDGGLRMLDRTVTAAKMLSKAKGASIDADLFLAAAVSVGAWGVGL